MTWAPSEIGEATTCPPPGTAKDHPSWPPGARSGATPVLSGTPRNCGHPAAAAGPARVRATCARATKKAKATWRRIGARGGPSLLKRLGSGRGAWLRAPNAPAPFFYFRARAALAGRPLRLIVVTGMPGAGKSVAVEVAREMGLPVFSMGDRVREVVLSRGLPLTPEVVGRTANAEREEMGADIWAKRTLAVIPPGTPVAVIDGARSGAEVEAFRAQAGAASVRVLALQASPATRRGRLATRARSDDEPTQQGFEDRDRRELSWGIGEAVARADVTVVNEGRLKAFKAALRRVLAGLAAEAPRASPARGTRGSRARRPSARRARGRAGRARRSARSRGRTRPSRGR